jgi:hypothetical protein
VSAPFTVWESISPALGCGLRPDQVERLVTEYLAGNSVQKFANGWHLHRTTVAEHLHRAGVPVRHRCIPDERLDGAIGSTAMGGHVAALLSTAVTTKQHVKHSDAQESRFARRGNADALRMSNQEGSWYSRASSAA